MVGVMMMMTMVADVATARARPSGDHLVGQHCAEAHQDEEDHDHGGGDEKTDEDEDDGERFNVRNEEKKMLWGHICLAVWQAPNLLWKANGASSAFEDISRFPSWIN